jgi:hypothetical protein
MEQQMLLSLEVRASVFKLNGVSGILAEWSGVVTHLQIFLAAFLGRRRHWVRWDVSPRRRDKSRLFLSRLVRDLLTNSGKLPNATALAFDSTARLPSL